MRTFLLGLLLLAGACAPVGPPPRGGAGFTTIVLPGDGPRVPVGIWYPTAAPALSTTIGPYAMDVAADAAPAGLDLPLIVIAHGNGGTMLGHNDTAIALARAGFVVAAPTFPGDNYRDRSRELDQAGRVGVLSRVIDAMLAGTWRPGPATTTTPGSSRGTSDAIDPARIGAFGFSAGGLTVLAAAGGVPDLSLLEPHCAAHPAFFDCRLLRADAAQLHGLTQRFVPDRRIRAIVVAAPGLGFTLVHGLASVTLPVQLWRAERDQVLPAPFYADAVRAALPRPPDFHDVPGAGHYDFLAPCDAALAAAAPPICTSGPGFSRAAFHATFDAAVVAFFSRTLPRATTTATP